MTTRPSGARLPRVLHIVDNLGAGGMQKILLALVEQTRDRFTHSICCVRDRGSMADRFEAASIRVDWFDKPIGHDWSVPWRVAQLCRRLRPDIVHTRNWGTVDGIVGARLARVPVVVHSEHGWDAVGVPARRRWMLWTLSPAIDALVAVSNCLGSWLCDIGIPPHKVSVVRNGVDTNRFRPRQDRERLRRGLGYEADDRVVIAVARLDPVKNYPLLVAAFEEIARHDPQARLLIVGAGPERTRIESDVERRRLGSVIRLAGHRENVEDWFAAADVFVHASLSEGLTNAALEAMASGLPVVATRVGGLQEIVVDGVSGRLIPGGDRGALIEAIAAYCADPAARAQHGMVGRARVVAEFTPQAMVAAYVALYEETLARRGVLPVEAPAPLGS